jgi:hypothetical protein
MKHSKRYAAGAAALMLVSAAAACGGSTGPAARATIRGAVTLGSQLDSVPACPAGSARSAQDFVPTATLSTNSNAVHSGTVGADGTYSMASVQPGVYLMGYDRFAVFGNDTLQFNATPSIGQLSVGSGETATVDYTIDGATCHQH